jgi:hypothetical protein
MKEPIIFCDYFVTKCKIYLLKFQRTYRICFCFFFPPLETLRHVDFVKNNHTIFSELLFRLYASMNCVTSQLTVTPFSAHTLTRVCHFSKQSMTHRPTSHFLQQKRVLLIFLVSEHTRLCFPFKERRCECFTSSRLNWAPDELGLPREMPLTVIFTSCICTIKSHTSVLQNFLCVIFPPHDLCNK